MQRLFPRKIRGTMFKKEGTKHKMKRLIHFFGSEVSSLTAGDQSGKFAITVLHRGLSITNTGDPSIPEFQHIGDIATVAIQSHSMFSSGSHFARDGRRVPLCLFVSMHVISPVLSSFNHGPLEPTLVLFPKGLHFASSYYFTFIDQFVDPFAIDTSFERIF